MNRVLSSTRWKSQCALLSCALLVAIGCKWNPSSTGPSIEFTQVPHAGAGGPDRTEYIGGKVTGANPGQKIVVYSQSEVWWVQPTVEHPLTEIQPNSTWKNIAHLGTVYAALLVDANYRPAPRMGSLPPIGNGVSAVATVVGPAGDPIVTKTIHFSGYDWA